MTVTARDRDVFPHVAAYVPLLALDRDVFPHVAAYVPLPLRTGYVQAICHQCGHSFNSGIVMTGGSSGTLQDNTSQCPRCGGIERIPDGSYRDGILQTLRDSDLDRDDLIRLRESIQSAVKSRKPQKTSRAVNDAMALAPGLAERWRPQTPADRYAFLQALLAAIVLLLMIRPAPQTTITNNITIINKNATICPWSPSSARSLTGTS